MRGAVTESMNELLLVAVKLNRTGDKSFVSSTLRIAQNLKSAMKNW